MELEKTIKNILEEIKKTEKIDVQNSIESGKEEESYFEEFDFLFNQIPRINEMKIEFTKWADKQEIDDYQKLIVNGEGVYENLVNSTRKEYVLLRKEGYTRNASLNKASFNFAYWMQKTIEPNENKGTIYLNYSPGFIRRLNKLSMLD